MAATSLTILRLAWDLVTNLLISLCFFIYALLVCPDLAASCAVKKHNKEDLNADTTKNACRVGVHDHALVRQGEGDAARQDHVSPPRSEKLSDCE